MKEFFDDLKSSIWKDDRLLGMREIAEHHHFDFVERERFGTQAHSLKRFRLFDGKRGKRLKAVLYKSGPNSSLKTRIYDYIYFGDSKNRISTVFEFYLPQWTFSEMIQTENLQYELNEEFLDLLSEQKRIWIEISGSFMIFYFKHKPLKISEIMEQYEYIQDLLDALVHGHSNEEYV